MNSPVGLSHPWPIAALPPQTLASGFRFQLDERAESSPAQRASRPFPRPRRDRKSTRLNSSHGYISYAVFCLKKKKITRTNVTYRIHAQLPHAHILVFRITSTGST